MLRQIIIYFVYEYLDAEKKIIFNNVQNRNKKSLIGSVEWLVSKNYIEREHIQCAKKLTTQ